jgi:hypothetical protein
MRSTDSLIPALFASFGLSAKLDEHRLMAEWSQLVGAQIAAHTMPREVRGRTLWVVVDSSTWLHELTLLKPLLLAKIAPRAGKADVRDVRFVVGEVSAPEGASAPRPPPSKASRLAPEAEAAVDHAVSALADEELRESARRLLRKAAADPSAGG